MSGKNVTALEIREIPEKQTGIHCQTNRNLYKKKI